MIFDLKLSAYPANAPLGGIGTNHSSLVSVSFSDLTDIAAIYGFNAGANLSGGLTARQFSVVVHNEVESGDTRSIANNCQRILSLAEARWGTISQSNKKKELVAPEKHTPAVYIEIKHPNDSAFWRSEIISGTLILASDTSAKHRLGSGVYKFTLKLTCRNYWEDYTSTSLKLVSDTASAGGKSISLPVSSKMGDLPTELIVSLTSGMLSRSQTTIWLGCKRGYQETSINFNQIETSWQDTYEHIVAHLIVNPNMTGAWLVLLDVERASGDFLLCFEVWDRSRLLQRGLWKDGPTQTGLFELDSISIQMRSSSDRYIIVKAQAKNEYGGEIYIRSAHLLPVADGWLKYTSRGRQMPSQVDIQGVYDESYTHTKTGEIMLLPDQSQNNQIYLFSDVDLQYELGYIPRKCFL